jgi:hypothetical protein
LSIDRFLGNCIHALRRFDTQRTLPGWNLYSYVLTRESIAALFQTLSLTRECLLQYEVIYGAYQEVLQTIFRSKILPVYMDCYYSKEEVSTITTLHPCSWPLTTFRQRMQENRLSLFGFQGYLFARRSSVQPTSIVALRLALTYVAECTACMHLFEYQFSAFNETPFVNAAAFQALYVYIVVTGQLQLFDKGYADDNDDADKYFAESELHLLGLKQVIASERQPPL